MLVSIISVAAAASSLTTLYSFANPVNSIIPTSNLLPVGPYLFGESGEGGAYGNGTLYRIDLQTGQETIIYSFGGGEQGLYPQGGLILVGGQLFGIAESSGGNNGTIFAFDIKTSTLSVAYTFPGGNESETPYSALINVGGTLYGTAFGGSNNCGTIFAFNLTQGTRTVLYTFGGASNPNDGCSPAAALINVGGVLYGTTTIGGGNSGCNGQNCGTVFKYDIATGVESVVHRFNGTDGQSPEASLTDVGGQLYGTTHSGGEYTFGTVFQIDPASGVTTVLHSFAGGADGQNPDYPLVEAGGQLYGTTYTGGSVSGCTPILLQTAISCGTLFEIDPAAKTETVLYNFTGTPLSGLTLSGGNLYGATDSDGRDGAAGCGSVFEFAPATQTVTALHSFSACVPQNASLAAVGSSLIATAAVSGSAGFGSIIKLTPATNTATTLYNFSGSSDGLGPNSPVISIQNALYGVASGGGVNGQGVLYQINPGAKTETVLHAFQGGPDGCDPNGTLLDISSTLYGITSCGGEFGSGTAFKLSLSNDAETVFANFGSKVAPITPFEGLTLVKGTFLGAAHYASIYKINVATGALSVVVGPALGPEGGPSAQMINVNGILYGVCSYGRDYGGNVFAFNPFTRGVTILYTFTGGSDGSSPQGPLLYDNGVLYGTTGFGGANTEESNGYGTVFSLTIATGVEKILYTFTGGADGANPGAALVTLGGKIYGTTNAGGAAGLGTIFELTP
jgi:uncharacterized repeat protein (TIGR03803 family)